MIAMNLRLNIAALVAGSLCHAGGENACPNKKATKALALADALLEQSGVTLDNHAERFQSVLNKALAYAEQTLSQLPEPSGPRPTASLPCKPEAPTPQPEKFRRSRLRRKQ